MGNQHRGKRRMIKRGKKKDTKRWDKGEKGKRGLRWNPPTYQCQS
jgi:hypothetical protein